MVAIDAIKSGLEKFRPVTKRLTLKKGLNGATIIDDCYNASPDSVSAAIDVLSNYAGEKILVLGDMLELGTVAEQAHLDIGVKAKRLGINRIMATGELTPLTIKSFGNNGEYFKDKSHLIDQLLSRVTADTVILIKGSRSTHMEEVTSALMTD
jgi:UDP-N-acetylmuramoyl-tripeptide--D-alanyl-D-alanine ligase